MENLIKNGGKLIVVKFYSMDKEDENIPRELEGTLEKKYRVFQEIPKGIPTSRDHEHEIELIPRSTAPNKRPYKCPQEQKGDI